ncbi:hypothetical protein QP568_09740 [Propionimicrobium lymphophilum]|uniref:Uncharacterized protein n=1 Tax=Propionimicrobium lymphophilum ACS-093-V-SCH5 TaxID=883161 RepID=S2W3K3_9ACTN|nr:hypothetical protein [Propionimicrobium lymphophilum]EPD32930.1 hypothetical protein HMPREF9306_01238 [Propionimicrobium lymphophilum ACS-093-V-SCH5]MDK7710633.1 hypothetical protein [Propionimicrobium lymphophilum]MDK7734564.1 hypothetical protein [Propionimicrobium lymphophilum]
MIKHLNREESTDLPYRVSTADGDVGADNLIEIVAWLFDCPEYVDFNPEQALEKRIECCCILAENAQIDIAGYLELAGAWDYEQEDPDIVELLTRPDRTSVIPLESWEHPVPLVLVQTLYAPHSDVPPVQGNVSWIDPLDDKRMLDSFNELGTLKLAINE